MILILLPSKSLLFVCWSGIAQFSGMIAKVSTILPILKVTNVDSYWLISGQCLLSLYFITLALFLKQSIYRVVSCDHISFCSYPFSFALTLSTNSQCTFTFQIHNKIHSCFLNWLFSLGASQALSLQLKSWLYVLIVSCTRFRVNPYSIVAWMSRNSLLKAGTKYEV